MADQQPTAPPPIADPNAGYPPATYPPQQPAYPPQQQPAYPPQQQPAYPPQQQAAGYPGYPPQGSYPPQPGPGYPPKQPEYPPQPGFTTAPPPPYQPQPTAGYPPTKQQSSSTNVVVVQQQPTVVHTRTVYTRHYGQGDHGLLYAIAASCCLFWFVGCPGLICTIAGIFFALNAQQDENAGNVEAMKQHHSWSMILTTVGLVVGLGFAFIWIISSATSR